MYDSSREGNNEVFSKKVKAGKRTYFFDVKTTRGNDYFITITESKKRQEDGMYIKHKIFLYKEDFNKFMEAFQETVGYVKTELMPEYNFDEFQQKPDDLDPE
ncbi:MAG: DUF3276 family protein [Flavobacteriales bacterium]|nr:DUF3276 family protein [Flavobacteriales bacterium]